MFHALKGTEYKLALGEDSIVDDHIPELMEANNVAVECLHDTTGLEILYKPRDRAQMRNKTPTEHLPGNI